MDHPAATLDRDLRVAAVRIAALIRNGEVAPLVGAGLSVQSGLPTWPRLVQRLLELWQHHDPSPAAAALKPRDYTNLIHEVFNKNSMTVTSYVRRMISKYQPPHGEVPSFDKLVQQALYSSEAAPSGFVPFPKQTHKHLIALVDPHPQRIWTTNYDDLLEHAALAAGKTVRVLHPGARSERAGLSVAHLHGFLPPPARDLDYPTNKPSPLILAEDDFHLVSWDSSGWVTQEFLNLLDRYRVLILGMSLDDPNLRRVLALNTARSIEAREEPRQHFAVVKQDQFSSNEKQRWYREYWEAHGVELIELPSHEHLLPFLARLRYETYGGSPGVLWRAASQRVASFSRRHPASLALMHRELNKAMRSMQIDFDVPADEIIEIGIFLINDDCRTLELSFRSGQEPDEPPEGRQFSIAPDDPTGTAGRVFVSSDIVRIDRNHPLFDYGLSDDEKTGPTDYAGLISVPIIDWSRGGLPLGVTYLTTSTIDGRIFSLPENIGATTSDKTLDDLYTWLHRWSLATLDNCCRD